MKAVKLRLREQSYIWIRHDWDGWINARLSYTSLRVCMYVRMPADASCSGTNPLSFESHAWRNTSDDAKQFLEVCTGFRAQGWDLDLGPLTKLKALGLGGKRAWKLEGFRGIVEAPRCCGVTHAGPAGQEPNHAIDNSRCLVACKAHVSPRHFMATVTTNNAKTIEVNGVVFCSIYAEYVHANDVCMYVRNVMQWNGMYCMVCMYLDTMDFSLSFSLSNIRNI